MGRFWYDKMTMSPDVAFDIHDITIKVRSDGLSMVSFKWRLRGSFLNNNKQENYLTISLTDDNQPKLEEMSIEKLVNELKNQRITAADNCEGVQKVIDFNRNNGRVHVTYDLEGYLNMHLDKNAMVYRCDMYFPRTAFPQSLPELLSLKT